MKVLFAASEMAPLIKTGGLADVAGSLPAALAALKTEDGNGGGAALDMRVILPAYRGVIEAAGELREVARLQGLGPHPEARLLQGELNGGALTLYLLDAPAYFHRDGGPYLDHEGQEWPDNAARFHLFCRAIESVALDQAGLDWRPDLVHCNDWQTGLAPALLHEHPRRPATLFTIHNLAYQGIFPADNMAALSLPAHWWSMHALEFHGNLSFIKGGLVYADYLTTVSPTYAREIQSSPEFGHGLEGLLAHRADSLSGILNGVDYGVWDPATDRLLPYHYTADSLDGKYRNKAALQKRLALPVSASTPLIGLVSRLAWQKGIDFFLRALPALLEHGVHIAVLGSGEQSYETDLREAAARHPRQISVTLGYNEELAHLIEAGSDMFVMASRYEPCGLNQLYSLRYGSVPIVRRTGGLADSVLDVDGPGGEHGTGFTFERAASDELLATVERALARFAQAKRWHQLVSRGMRRDFSWRESARNYLALYGKLAAKAGAERDGPD